MNTWIIPLVLLAAYAAAFAYLRRRGPRAGFAAQFPVLLWRTSIGKRVMQKVAKLQRAWAVLADIGIATTLLAGSLFIAFLAYRAIEAVRDPTTLMSGPSGARFLLAIPGVNPTIPVGVGIVALLVALLAHEAAHGIVAYANRMRVKSTGIVLFVVPVGAFVEPEPDDLAASTRRVRLRVLAAGPAMNIALALLAGLLLTTLVMPKLAVTHEGAGIGVATVTPNSPAANAGLTQGDILLKLDQTPVGTTRDYLDALSARHPGDTLVVTRLHEGTTSELTVTLADRADFIPGAQPGKGFLGASALDLAALDHVRTIVAHPFDDGARSFTVGSMRHAPGSFVFFTSYPLVAYETGMDIFSPPSSTFITTTAGPMHELGPTPLLLAASFLYWTVWLNVMLALFNALPLGPLDGGQMVQVLLSRKDPKPEDAARTRAATRATSMLVVGLLLAPTVFALIY